MINVQHLFRNLIRPGAFRIPKSVSVNGGIDATISGRIDGHVRGNVKTTGKLIISENASIKGHVYATDLVIYGKVFGDVYISNKAYVTTKAYVKGDVNAMILEIEEGAVVEGAIRKNIQAVQQSEEPVVALPVTESTHSSTAAIVPPPHPEEEQRSSWF
ncbi:polymer-forming protein [Chitinophaga dinghuensis]|uniref:Polymer-forming protein n=1 Tax=Chitinophaga dinghuensis TaxID=1539050 RepID=A0A327VSX2_9BACT|nr:polymer-forming cytoskeletal protein [Chitinophaga dinghuensis]RAJ79151.1 polymer-forming protein [Chitinophaga dinghuensis]